VYSQIYRLLLSLLQEDYICFEAVLAIARVASAINYGDHVSTCTGGPFVCNASFVKACCGMYWTRWTKLSGSGLKLGLSRKAAQDTSSRAHREECMVPQVPWSPLTVLTIFHTLQTLWNMNGRRMKRRCPFCHCYGSLEARFDSWGKSNSHVPGPDLRIGLRVASSIFFLSLSSDLRDQGVCIKVERRLLDRLWLLRKCHPEHRRLSRPSGRPLPKFLGSPGPVSERVNPTWICPPRSHR
jgi:hypothetical protein